MSTATASWWKEFRPTITFLIRFVVVYIGANLVYGVFITLYEPEVDPITRIVTRQSAGIVSLLGWDAHALDYPRRSTTYIQSEGKGIVSVYEGCNGINVMVVFMAFMTAFGPLNRKFVIFSGISLLSIYVMNLARIIFLFFVVIYLPRYSYFVHKYLFTAFIYVVVFGLWIVWVRRYAKTT